jgi:hypothetical protein
MDKTEVSSEPDMIGAKNRMENEGALFSEIDPGMTGSFILANMIELVLNGNRACSLRDDLVVDWWPLGPQGGVLHGLCSYLTI